MFHILPYRTQGLRYDDDNDDDADLLDDRMKKNVKMAREIKKTTKTEYILSIINALNSFKTPRPKKQILIGH